MHKPWLCRGSLFSGRCFQTSHCFHVRCQQAINSDLHGSSAIDTTINSAGQSSVRIAPGAARPVGAEFALWGVLAVRTRATYEGESYAPNASGRAG
jgi:hypothetical protein